MAGVTARLAGPARAVHPGAWWLWALGLAAAADRTTNPLLLALVLLVTAYVVAARRTDAPWGRSYGSFLRLALVLLALRIALQVVFGSGIPGRVLLPLPTVPLPGWAAGVHLGGPVTLESLAVAGYQGLQLAALLVCLGAANALCSPSRLLKAVPGALYEVGVALTVALSFAPQAVLAVARIREARALRGRRERGLRAWRGLALPVLEDALERSVALAAAMDVRGFGRRAAVPPGRRRWVGGLTLAGLVGLAAGLYGLLDGGTPGPLGLPLLAAGGAFALGGLAASARGVRRTRYRPDPWAAPEWLIAASGLVALLGMLTAGADTGSVTLPLTAPTLPLLPAAGLLVALLPSVVAPAVPS